MIRRLIHSTTAACSIKKQSLQLTKMMNSKGSRKWYPASDPAQTALPSVKILMKTKYEPGNKGVRRKAMLNKLFMKCITDLLSTGTVSLDIVGRGIEISKVEVSNDYHTVNVYWVCKGTAGDVETERLLKDVAGALRHELSTLRVIGEVPYIVFVKDRAESHVAELDRRLMSADYGEDFKPTHIGRLLKSELTLSTKISPEVQAKLKQIDMEHEVVDEPIPEMTHTVFNLDHKKILARLLAVRKTTRDAWSKFERDDVISYTTSERKPDHERPSLVKQEKELAEFLKKRQLQEKGYGKKNLSSPIEMEIDQKQDANEYYYDDDFDEEDDILNDEIDKNSDYRNIR